MDLFGISAQTGIGLVMVSSLYLTCRLLLFLQLKGGSIGIRVPKAQERLRS